MRTENTGETDDLNSSVFILNEGDDMPPNSPEPGYGKLTTPDDEAIGTKCETCENQEIDTRIQIKWKHSGKSYWYCREHAKDEIFHLICDILPGNVSLQSSAYRVGDNIYIKLIIE